jgi:pimeloyl-ACP methyl ester carboxylesterase
VHVGDIDVACKTFGKGNNTIILINGAGENMNFWDQHFLKELSTNNSVIVFDSRGIGNTTLGNKPFTISQFANDTAGLLDALKINKKSRCSRILFGFIDSPRAYSWTSAQS